MLKHNLRIYWPEIGGSRLSEETGGGRGGESESGGTGAGETVWLCVVGGGIGGVELDAGTRRASAGTAEGAGNGLEAGGGLNPFA